MKHSAASSLSRTSTPKMAYNVDTTREDRLQHREQDMSESTPKTFRDSQGAQVVQGQVEAGGEGCLGHRISLTTGNVHLNSPYEMLHEMLHDNDIFTHNSNEAAPSTPPPPVSTAANSMPSSPPSLEGSALHQREVSNRTEVTQITEYQQTLEAPEQGSLQDAIHAMVMEGESVLDPGDTDLIMTESLEHEKTMQLPEALASTLVHREDGRQADEPQALRKKKERRPRFSMSSQASEADSPHIEKLPSELAQVTRIDSDSKVEMIRIKNLNGKVDSGHLDIAFDHSNCLKKQELSGDANATVSANNSGALDGLVENHRDNDSGVFPTTRDRGVVLWDNDSNASRGGSPSDDGFTFLDFCPGTGQDRPPTVVKNEELSQGLEELCYKTDVVEDLPGVPESFSPQANNTPRGVSIAHTRRTSYGVHSLSRARETVGRLRPDTLAGLSKQWSIIDSEEEAEENSLEQQSWQPENGLAALRAQSRLMLMNGLNDLAGNAIEEATPAILQPSGSQDDNHAHDISSAKHDIDSHRRTTPTAPSITQLPKIHVPTTKQYNKREGEINTEGRSVRNKKIRLKAYDEITQNIIKTTRANIKELIASIGLDLARAIDLWLYAPTPLRIFIAAADLKTFSLFMYV